MLCTCCLYQRLHLLAVHVPTSTAELATSVTGIIACDVTAQSTWMLVVDRTELADRSSM